jgi:hypothetical protein
MPAPHSCITPSPSSPHAPPNPLSHLLLHIPSSSLPKKKFQQKSPQKKKKKKKSYYCSSLSKNYIKEILHKKTKKKNSANARREALEKHWHRLQEEACVVD